MGIPFSYKNLDQLGYVKLIKNAYIPHLNLWYRLQRMAASLATERLKNFLM